MTNSEWARNVLQIMIDKNNPIKLLTGPTGWIWIKELWGYQYFYNGINLGDYVSQIALDTLKAGGVYYTQSVKGSDK